MGNYQNQSIYPVTREISYFDLHSRDEKEGNQIFINTVRQHFGEIVRLENKDQEPATIVVQEGDTNLNGGIKQDENNKKLTENMLKSNILKSMMNNIQADGNMVSLLARDIDIPLTIRESITNMLGDMLSKVNDVWKTSSLPQHFQTEKQSSDKATTEDNDTEIEVEVCTKRKEITFWGKTKSTSLKMATLFLPSELLNDKGGSNNDTLPFYNPGQ